MTEYFSESFTLCFANASAVLNYARTAIGDLLTIHLGVKRFAVVKGKLRPIYLRQRIRLLLWKCQEKKDLLLAVKWICNAGSHDGGKAMTADLRVAYDLLVHVRGRGRN